MGNLVWLVMEGNRICAAFSNKQSAQKYIDRFGKYINSPIITNVMVDMIPNKVYESGMSLYQVDLDYDGTVNSCDEAQPISITPPLHYRYTDSDGNQILGIDMGIWAKSKEEAIKIAEKYREAYIKEELLKHPEKNLELLKT